MKNFNYKMELIKLEARSEFIQWNFLSGDEFSLHRFEVKPACRHPISFL